ncbi:MULTISPECIES: catalase/peroxidase HPI [Sphingobium]|uniref:Catalase-peroxidase n=1 Tax=Sphingobium yanoikuyae ATCC 51230 TaxID=883163 RepID=K9D947_SPHYA|nr:MULTISPECIES: catalase/peroxidase HPI [Sphingobium]EKU75402.1 catalase/peroxidase HPI [Sphingobium yanoikuyae ATCC 51230]WQE07277.1 catalase/peroxidase HPI [Sphingobium yanoikuyae]SHL68913.1 catalase-peroxidase [Sphingobium sp. YR657]
MSTTRISTFALACALLASPALAAETKPAAAAAPVVTEKPGGMTNKDWWPNRLDLTALRQHEATRANPYGADYDYVKEFNSLDLDAVKADIRKVLTTSQPWWPADYGHYGPFFIRMAWHSAGTYRVGDGRGGSDGGEQRFDPLNSWPDNVSLDKARRLVWPIKQKYGRKLSWGDLMVLSGNVALEDMGFKTVGFAGGRIDAWQPDVVYWGPETKMMGTERSNPDGSLKRSLAATTMGLIYVNPEGPGANHDPKGAAADIRRAFGNMAMDDEETLALIAGGHTFGKAHGAKKPEECLGAEPAAAGIEDQGFGWKNKCGKGNAEDTLTSGLEGAWSATPTQFTTQYIDNLLNFDWVKTKSPAGATQWIPTDPATANMVPDAHVKDKRHAPIMFTTDIALKEDPGFRKVLESWQKNPELFSKAFARAWFKLTHRDLGPQARYLGKDIPSETYSWQDPLPKASFAPVSAADQAKLKAAILASGLTGPELVRTAWASAATFRSTDMRGGANGARLRLDPQRGWAVNDPAELSKVLAKLTAIQKDFAKSGNQVSMADLIVLSGNAAVEQAAQKGGYSITVPFTPGRVDAAQAQTDVASFAYLEPKADGFRNWYGPKAEVSPADALVDKADALDLTVPEMTVLVGGMRALGANSGGSKNGVLTTRPGTLSNDFFVNLLTMDTVWSKSATPGLYDGKDRASGAAKWTATPVDLIFGSNSELRAVAEVYAEDDAKEKFVTDFVAAWTKVMNADRF